MAPPELPQSIFISSHSSDRGRAGELENLLPSDSVIWNGGTRSPDGESWRDELNAALKRAEVIVLLLGPQTRASRWVDYEIQHGTDPRVGGPVPSQQSPQRSVLSGWGVLPGAGLVGLLLPEHPDFRKPYYDPENVPVRLHGLVQQEYAIVKKWTEDREGLAAWLREAMRRRLWRLPERTRQLVTALETFAWDDSADCEKGTYLTHEPLAR